MSSEAKQLFANHQLRTCPVGWSTVGNVTMKTPGSPDKGVYMVARLEIRDDPADAALPEFRRQMLARDAKNPDERFLLDQTITLGVDDTRKGVPASRARLFVWDTVTGRSHEVPINEMQLIAGTAVRMADFLLPFPEVSEWTIPAPVPTPKSGVALPPGCRALVITIPPPDPGASLLTQWLWPDILKVTMWMADGDLRLHLVETELTGGRYRTMHVTEWLESSGIVSPAKYTVSDFSGARTEAAFTLKTVKAYTDGYFTRLRLDAGNF